MKAVTLAGYLHRSHYAHGLDHLGVVALIGSLNTMAARLRPLVATCQVTVPSTIAVVPCLDLLHEK